MANITTNQHSYSNASALLSVTATAVRASATTVDITANWTIKTAGSSLASASRYLVLYLSSSFGAKYYSSSLRTSWSSNQTYTGSYTFKGIPLASASTSIKIGFGVSASNSSMSTSGTLVWNGSSSVSSSSYDPDIQLNSITGIAQGYAACTAPTSFTVTPNPFTNPNFNLSWSGASGGTNNAISLYEISVRQSTNNGSTWTSWSSAWIGYSDGVNLNNWWLVENRDVDLSNATRVQFRIRTRGTAGESYYSGWKESSVLQKITACTAPTSFTYAAEWDKSIAFSWSGASGGGNNTIWGYEIHCAYSTDGITWSEWTRVWYGQNNSAVTLTESTLSDKGMKIVAGNRFKFRIRTLDAHDWDEDECYSPWKEGGLTKYMGNCVWIHHTSGMGRYAPYIHNGTSWEQYAPYNHDGNTWNQCN